MQRRNRKYVNSESRSRFSKTRTDSLPPGYRTDKVRQLAQYLTIRELSAKYSVFRLCSELCVSRSSYYKWLSRKPSKAEMRNRELDEKIVFLFDRYDEVYG